MSSVKCWTVEVIYYNDNYIGTTVCAGGAVGGKWCCIAVYMLSERFAFVNNYICVKCKLENATKVSEKRE